MEKYSDFPARNVSDDFESLIGWLKQAKESFEAGDFKKVEEILIDRRNHMTALIREVQNMRKGKKV